jgi:cobalt/nickel transport system permease protein
MHITEGILPAQTLAAGAALGAAGVAVGLKRLQPDDLPRAGLLSAAFFVASLLHVPAGPVSVHLVLNGLVGLLLGWGAFPAIFIGLALQCLFFGHGGLTVLGVNTVIMALPAVACHYLFLPRGDAASPAAMLRAGFLAGVFATVASAALMGLALRTAGAEFQLLATGVVAAYAVLALAEGAVTGFALSFVRRVRPEMLRPALAPGAD